MNVKSEKGQSLIEYGCSCVFVVLAIIGLLAILPYVWPFFQILWSLVVENWRILAWIVGIVGFIWLVGSNISLRGEIDSIRNPKRDEYDDRREERQ